MAYNNLEEIKIFKCFHIFATDEYFVELPGRHKLEKK